MTLGGWHSSKKGAYSVGCHTTVGWYRIGYSTIRIPSVGDNDDDDDDDDDGNDDNDDHDHDHNDDDDDDNDDDGNDDDDGDNDEDISARCGRDDGPMWMAARCGWRPGVDGSPMWTVARCGREAVSVLG